jgi:hypothetical protein
MSVRVCLAGAVAFIALLAGCGGAGGPSASQSAGSGQSSAPAQPNGEADAGVKAGDVVAAFAKAGLPARSPRDNTSVSCAGTLPGCVELVTTDDVSVYRFASQDAANKWAAFPDKDRVGKLVVSYSAARTPEKLRPRYKAIATEVATE